MKHVLIAGAALFVITWAFIGVVYGLPDLKDKFNQQTPTEASLEAIAETLKAIRFAIESDQGINVQALQAVLNQHEERLNLITWRGMMKCPKCGKDHIYIWDRGFEPEVATQCAACTEETNKELRDE